MNNPGRPPGCGGQIALGSAKRSAATSARASGAAGLSPAGSGSAHIAAAERTALPGPPGGETAQGRGPGAARGRGAPRGRCPPGAAPPVPPAGGNEHGLFPSGAVQLGPQGAAKKATGKGPGGRAPRGGRGHRGDAARGRAGAGAACAGRGDAVRVGVGTSGRVARLACDPHAACPGVRAGAHPWGRRVCVWGCAWASVAAWHAARGERRCAWHAERVRDTACPCDSACVRGSARVGEKPCSRSPQLPPTPRDRGAEPTRVRALPWEGAPGAKAAAGRAAGHGGGTPRPSPPAQRRGPLCPSPPCLLCAAGTGIFHLPAPLALTSGAGLAAGSARGGLPVLPRGRGRGRSLPGLAEGRGAGGNRGGRDGAGGCGPWRPALAGEPCQSCPASARPSAPAQVCAFPAPARPLLRGQRIPLKGGGRLKGCRGRGRPAAGVRARPRRATSP